VPEYRPARKFPLVASDGWWLNRWPVLGWLETVVKLTAFCVAAYVPLPEPHPYMPLRSDVSRVVFLAETFLMFGGSTLIALAIFDRLVYREIVSMLFVVPNNWAHWTVVSAMYRYGRGGVSVRHFRLFCWLMLAGDVIKLVFFAVHDFRILAVTRFVRSCMPDIWKSYRIEPVGDDGCGVTDDQLRRVSFVYSFYRNLCNMSTQVLYALVFCFAVLYGLILLLDYGYCRDLVVDVYAAVTAILPLKLRPL
jgi:hypothetical protein